MSSLWFKITNHALTLKKTAKKEPLQLKRLFKYYEIQRINSAINHALLRINLLSTKMQETI